MYSRRALILVELLVVSTILGLLVAILIPAVQAAREAARRTQCQNNIRQISLAVLNYASAHKESLPDLFRYREQPCASHGDYNEFSWRVTVLPFLEQQGFYDQLDLDLSALAPENHSIVGQVLPVYQCPSMPGYPRSPHQCPEDDNKVRVGPTVGATDYLAGFRISILGERIAGAWYNLGVWRNEIGDYDRSTARLSKITDGLSNTILITERSGLEATCWHGRWLMCDGGGWTQSASCEVQISWLRGGQDNIIPVAINVNPIFSIFSSHTSGANVAMCDGSVRFLSEDLNHKTVGAMLTRAGSEVRVD